MESPGNRTGLGLRVTELRLVMAICLFAELKNSVTKLRSVMTG